MYESPINIVEHVTKSLGKQIDDDLILNIEAVIGWHIDKEELIKALQYDRNQYYKGYHDGKRDQERWIMYIKDDPDSHPEDGEWVICTDGKSTSIERYKFDAIDHFYPSVRWFELEDMIAWMPLSSLPKRRKEDERDN